MPANATVEINLQRLDLDRDGVTEILLVYGTDARWWASVMKRDVRGGWNPAAPTAPPS